MTERSQPSAGTNHPGAETENRRRHSRRESEVGITVNIDTDQFAGLTQNVSQAGVFFFSNDSLRVTVELEQDGATIRRHGQLVRVERMNAETTGFAIEFDDE